MSSKSLEATYTQTFSRKQLYRVAGVEGVTSVMPCYIGFKAWRNPENKQKRSILVMGFNLEDRILKIAEVHKHLSDLQRQDTVLLNLLSRQEYGSPKVGLRTELGKRRIEVVGLFSMSTTFRADASVIVSDQNFVRLNPGRSIDDIDLGLITINPKYNINTTIDQLRQLLPENIEILNRSQAEARDQEFWVRASLIGYVFSIGAFVSFTVGTVIIYQILYTDVTDHIQEYATLKAIGYGSYPLAKVVLQESLILAVLGFTPGFFIGLGLYQIIYMVTKLPIAMSLQLGILVFIFTVLMCSISAILSIRKIIVIHPADVF